MNVVVNASPLIFLAKLNKIELLKMLFAQTFTTDDVLEEVYGGLQKGYQDAIQIKEAVQNNDLRILKIKQKLAFDVVLGRGEQSVLEAALSYTIPTVLLDDLDAIKIARYLKLEVISTPFILLRALQDKKLQPDDFVDLFERLVEKYNYRISPVLYKKILDSAKKI